MAVAVIGFETDANEYTVCPVAGTLLSGSENPNPSSQITCPL